MITAGYSEPWLLWMWQRRQEPTYQSRRSPTARRRSIGLRSRVNVDDIADVAVVDFLVVVILHLHDLVARREGPSETSDLVFASGVQGRLHHSGRQPPENAVCGARRSQQQSKPSILKDQS